MSSLTLLTIPHLLTYIRFEIIREEILGLSIDDLYPVTSTKCRDQKITQYKEYLTLIKDNWQLVKEIYPMMEMISKWTQGLASLNFVTSSKALLCLKDIKNMTTLLHNRAAVRSSVQYTYLLSSDFDN